MNQTLYLTDRLKHESAQTDKDCMESPMRILVAEDNEVNQFLLQKLFLRMGHEMVLAQDGREAVEKAQANTFDVYLLDIHMPKANGVEVMETLIKEKKAELPPAIALTADYGPSEVESYRKAGFDALLPKPLDLAQLREILNAIAVIRCRTQTS